MYYFSLKGTVDTISSDPSSRHGGTSEGKGYPIKNLCLINDEGDILVWLKIYGTFESSTRFKIGHTTLKIEGHLKQSLK